MVIVVITLAHLSPTPPALYVLPKPIIIQSALHGYSPRIQGEMSTLNGNITNG